MRFNRLRMHNIGSYAGISELDLRVQSSDKNIILIGGQNGTGKSSLFLAIKLALYGPLCFHYQGCNPAYFSRIKELISHGAFADDSVQSSVQLELDLENGQELANYTITRAWTFENQRIIEQLTVSRDSVELGEDGVQFFQNYLHTVLPPNLFDFFFFDGEQIADFFATSGYKGYIKTAILTLCSLDTFEIIRKFSDNYVGPAGGSDEFSAMTTRYNAFNDEYETTTAEITTIEERLAALGEELQRVQNDREELNGRFLKSGGLTAPQKDDLNRRLKEHDNRREVLSNRIRGFVEGLMPFVIAEQIAEAARLQLDREYQARQYDLITERLDVVFLNRALQALPEIQHSTRKEASVELSRYIRENLKPSFYDEGFTMIHDLSEEQKNRVQTILGMVEEFDPTSIIKLIERKSLESEAAIELGRSLRQSMSDLDAQEFTHRFTQLTAREYELKTEIDKLQDSLAAARDNQQVAVRRRDELRTELQATAQSRNAQEIAQKIAGIMDGLILSGTRRKFKDIEASVLYMLKRIMSKDCFIDVVELDESFDLHLFKRQAYTRRTLAQLARNVSQEELLYRLGERSMETLFRRYDVATVAMLRRALSGDAHQLSLFGGDEDEQFNLYQRIELNQLSKGERQIFILSLYWAIITNTSHDIPFVIDTPYARIDTEHREQITREFMPTISRQVIILSTDEEVTERYYTALKPLISQEYLLEYDEGAEVTSIRKGYFFEGKENGISA